MKAKAERALHRHLRREVLRRSPILAKVPRLHQHEGNDWVHGQGEEHPKSGGYEPIEAEYSLTRDEITAGDFRVMYAKYGAMAEKFAETQTRGMFAKISEAAEEVGNVVDAKGALKKEQFLELIEKVESDYDPESRKPKNTFFVAHPTVVDRLLPEVAEWEKDPDFKRRLEEVEERKWLAWRDRESRRRLAD